MGLDGGIPLLTRGGIKLLLPRGGAVAVPPGAAAVLAGYKAVLVDAASFLVPVLMKCGKRVPDMTAADLAAVAKATLADADHVLSCMPGERHVLVRAQPQKPGRVGHCA